MKKILFLLLSLILISACGTFTGEKVKIDLYIMSLCPYGVEAENSFIDVAKELKNAVDINIEFIAGEIGPKNFVSLHGQPEIEGDIIQLCAKEYHPEKYLDLISCMNENPGEIPNNWEECATDLDLETIKKCSTSDEGKELLSKSIKKSEAVQASGSPTIYINGNQYNGNRDSKSLIRAICQSYGAIKPSECNSIPEPTKVDLTIVNSKDCTTCDTSKVIEGLKQIFPGLKVNEIEQSSEDGEKLIKDLEIQILPAYIFDDKIKDTEIWTSNEKLRTLFEEKSDLFKVIDQATGATYFVDPVKRAEFAKFLEEKKKEIMQVLNVKDKPQIDFFIMSYCPYGNQAEETISDVYQALKNKVNYVPHYIFYENFNNGGEEYCLDKDNKYCSMHGVQEANQDIRELCVLKNYGIGKYFDFIKIANTDCSAENIDTCWETITQKAGIDKYKVRNCEKTEKLTLAKKELETTTKLQISGSPTIFINGEVYEGSRTATAYQKTLCKYFKDEPQECKTEIETTTQTTPSGGCGV